MAQYMCVDQSDIWHWWENARLLVDQVGWDANTALFNSPLYPFSICSLVFALPNMSDQIVVYEVL